MLRTKGLIVASLALVLGLTLGFFLSGLFNFERLEPVTYDATFAEPPQAFKVAIETVMRSEEQSTEGGFTPELLMTTFPGLLMEDFNDVAAVVGRYEYKDGVLSYSNTDLLDEVAANVSDEGYLTLRANVYRRLNLDAARPAASVIPLLKATLQPDTPTESPILPPATDAGTMCTQDVRECSDGSYVSRQAPGCAFAACPSGDTTSDETITCKPDQRLVDVCTEQYAPVCADYQVQCITTPCNPVPKTYSNSCFACMDNNVLSYSDGACMEEPPR